MEVSGAYSRLFDRISALPRALSFGIPVIVVLLAIQFGIFQLLLDVQYGDAPRNLHWGIYTAEAPGFLINTPDRYERVKGFPPTPASLAPNHFYQAEGNRFHPWWGPVFPLLFAIVWWLTGSYRVLQQVVPVAAGIDVILVYVLARKLLPRGAVLAAALFGLMPLVREYGVISYVECLSTLVLFVALWSFVEGNTVVAVIFGVIAVLAKRDVAALYLGVGTAAMLWDRWRGQRVLELRRGLPALIIPSLVYVAWFAVTLQRPPSGLGGFSIPFFMLVAPQMIPLFLYIPWPAAVATIFLLGWLAYRGWSTLDPSLWKTVLSLWLIGGLGILLIYAGTRGAGNSPRVMIPALPPLMIFVARGLMTLQVRWRNRLRFYLVALFLMLSVGITYYQYLRSREVAQYRPAFAWLKQQPEGFVLSEQYWPTLLYTRQPTTWFEFDPEFERNIMRDRAHFEQYISMHHIRYVILPPGEELASAEVRRFLQHRAAAQHAGDLDVYRLY